MDEGAMLACMAYVDLNPVRARIADTLEDYEFTSVYDRMIAERASKRVKESRKLASPTQAQRAIIGKEEAAAKRADWLLDFNGSESPFEGVDLGFYLSQTSLNDLVSCTSVSKFNSPKSANCPPALKLEESALGHS